MVSPTASSNSNKSHPGQEEKEEANHPAPETAPRQVRFGSVCVHTHKLKLGCNPGMLLKGPPLTIDWKAEITENFPTVDSFYQHYHPDDSTTNLDDGGDDDDTKKGKNGVTKRNKPVYRLTSAHRREIAQNYGDESDEIDRVEQEILTIQQARKESAKEPNSDSIKELVYLQKQKAAQEKKNKKKKGLFGGLFSRR
eukprot:scaffold297_cov171-Amphora_coffeaeformis.AAC.13